MVTLAPIFRWLAAALLALALPAGACAQTAGGGGGGDSMGRIAQADTAGEACISAITAAMRHDPAVPAPLTISCNGNATAVGAIRASSLPLAIPPAGAGRRAAIAAAARRSLASAEFARRMDCRAGQWAALADRSEIEVSLCRLREGNWPQLVLTYAQGRVLYQAAGLPVLLPVMTRAIAAQSGKALELPAGWRDPDGVASLLGAPIPSSTARDFAATDEALRQARLASSRADAAGAEAAYRSALEIQARVFGASSPGAGEVLIALALEVSNQQRFDEAASLFRQADPIIDRSAGDFFRARLLAYRALDAANRQQYSEALQYARAATALRRRAVTPADDFSDDAGRLAAQGISRAELLHSLMIEAQMLMRLDDLASAEAAAGEALDIIVHTDGLPPWWRPNVLAFMGELNERENRLAVAERQDLDSLRYRQRIFGESGPTALSWLALGRLYGEQDARVASLAAYHSAFDILDRDRTTRASVSFGLIAPFFKVASDPAAKPTPEVDAEIFRAIQLTGASVTDQTIERSANRLAAGDPAIADLLRQNEEAQGNLGALRVGYADAVDKPAQLRDAKQEAALAAQIVAGEAALAQSDRQLRANYPAISGLLNPSAVPLAHFRTQLAPDEAVITFALGARDSWAVMVTRDRIVARPLTATEASVTEEVTSLRRAFVPRLGRLAPFDVPLAQGLYRELLGPLEDQFGGVHHIVFVAHGPLASLPLAVLVTPAPVTSASANGGTTDWLVRHYAISQVPTLGSFVALREAGARRAAAPRPILAFAAPAFTGLATDPRPGQASALTAMADQCRQGQPISADLLRALTPLPETATEAGVVAHLLGSGEAVHVGADASEAVLRQQPLDQYRVLYFATHGLLPGELHCQAEPGLALSPPATTTTRATDGLLESSEIAAFRLNADLVVLSACNTAEGGGRFGGDALSGLAEAFFYAGARGLIASHWEVPSQATVSLMTGLFARAQTDGTAEALRQSQLRLIGSPDTAHPFYWAAFTLIGDGLPKNAAMVTGR